MKGSDRPPGLIQNNTLKMEIEGNATENRLGGQWRQQPLSAAFFENHGMRSSYPQHVFNRDQPFGSPNGQSDINVRRGTVQNEKNLAGNTLKDIKPSKSADNPNKGLSSAEFNFKENVRKLSYSDNSLKLSMKQVQV